MCDNRHTRVVIEYKKNYIIGVYIYIISFVSKNREDRKKKLKQN